MMCENNIVGGEELCDFGHEPFGGYRHCNDWLDTLSESDHFIPHTVDFRFEPDICGVQDIRTPNKGRQLELELLIQSINTNLK